MSYFFIVASIVSDVEEILAVLSSFNISINFCRSIFISTPPFKDNFITLKGKLGKIRREFILNDRAKEQRNAYMKEWRKRNKDKVKAAQEKYWEKKFKEKEKESVS